MNPSNAFKNLVAGGEVHAGDGGYSIGTREGYESFVAVRNQSLLEGAVSRTCESLRDNGDPFSIDTADLLDKMLADNKSLQELKKAVFTVLEGFTLDGDVRKILESAYYSR